MGRVVAWVSVAAWGWACLVALLDRRVVPRLVDVGPAGPGAGRVTVIVPARDEEGRIGRSLDSLAAQAHDDLEVVVVDDRSSDGTLAEARSRASARVRVVEGAPLPAGWVGKSWAIHQGVAHATGDWLLFSDADVVHAPDVVARAVALAVREDAPGVTLLCHLGCVTPLERIVQPAAVVLIGSFVAPGPIVRSRRWPHAIAIGAFILVRRDVYEAAGGHEAIGHKLVDDRALGELLKHRGTPLLIADGTGHLSVHMYESAGELWRGWRKNTSVGASESSPVLALVSAVGGLATSLGPLWCLARGPRRVGALGFALQVGARIAANTVAPTPRRYWPTLALGSAFLCVVSLVSTVDRLSGGVVWRGRRYRV